MMTLWKSLIQSKLDYTCQLWSLSDQASIESVAIQFTSRVDGMAGLDYWDRLSSLHLYSQERRRERYQIIFLWKVVQVYQANFHRFPRRGRLMDIQPLCPTAPASVKRARESSLQVKGAKLCNTIPRDLRDTMVGTPEYFKARLYDWLSSVPDQPTILSRVRVEATNSLLDQVQYLL